MVLNIICTGNIHDYLNAAGQLKEGDLIYATEFNADDGHKEYSVLLKYESHDEPSSDSRHFTIHGAASVLLPGKYLRADKFISIFIKTTQLITGPREEIRQVFINEFNANIDAKIKDIREKAQKDVENLEALF